MTIVFQVQNKPNNINPLICGNQHASQWGMPGYNLDYHWCTMGYNEFINKGY